MVDMEVSFNCHKLAPAVLPTWSDLNWCVTVQEEWAVAMKVTWARMVEVTEVEVEVRGDVCCDLCR
jgi:hypothetical protein